MTATRRPVSRRSGRGTSGSYARGPKTPVSSLTKTGKSLSSTYSRLEGVRFIKNAGSMRDKAERMEEIAGRLARTLGLSEAEAKAAKEAALSQSRSPYGNGPGVSGT